MKLFIQNGTYQIRSLSTRAPIYVAVMTNQLPRDVCGTKIIHRATWYEVTVEGIKIKLFL
jgi:hypothetical protein